MIDEKYENLIIRAIKGDTDALNEVQPEIRARLEKEMEKGNPFLTLVRAMFDPHFFDGEKPKDDFINQIKNDTIK